MNDKKIILITGGIRSGKSCYALRCSLEVPGPKVFLATATPLDDEMRKRIHKHQKERSSEFLTIEEPKFLAKAILSLESKPEVILIDCLTLWLSNLLYLLKEDDQKTQKEISDFLKVLGGSPSTIIMVTNEVGLGVVPENALSRKFIDELGILNQKIAKLCDEVILMTSGIPQKIKGTVHVRKMDRTLTGHSGNR